MNDIEQRVAAAICEVERQKNNGRFRYEDFDAEGRALFVAEAEPLIAALAAQGLRLTPSPEAEVSEREGLRAAEPEPWHVWTYRPSSGTQECGNCGMPFSELAYSDPDRFPCAALSASDSGEVAEGSGATDHHFGLQMSTMGIGRGFDQRRAQQAFPHGDPRHLHYLDEWDAALTRPVPETPRCPTCDHLMSMHRDEFGCEHEFCLSDDKTETLCGEYGPLETPEAAPSSETRLREALTAIFHDTLPEDEDHRPDDPQFEPHCAYMAEVVLARLDPALRADLAALEGASDD